MAKGISTYYGQQYLTAVEPNILLNSDMYRWQRGVSLVVDNDYTCDRFAARAVNQLLASSSSVQLIEDSIIPTGVGARKSAVINANQIATSLGFGQRIESTELDSYRGKMMQFSTYIQRIASLPGSNIQLAYSEAASPNTYTGNYLNDMPNLMYDSSFDGLTTIGFDRVSGEILITDSMADNGIQIGLKIVNAGETTAELTGNLCRVTGFMLNQSTVLTPYKKAFSSQTIENEALEYYYEKFNEIDAAIWCTEVGGIYFGFTWRRTKRIPPALTYDPTRFAGAGDGSPYSLGPPSTEGCYITAGAGHLHLPRKLTIDAEIR